MQEQAKLIPVDIAPPPVVPLAQETAINQVPATNTNTRFYLNAAIGGLNGVLYFFIAAAGAGNLKNFFHLENDSAMQAMYGLGAGASLCYGMFSYKTMEGLTLKPTTAVGWTLSALAPIAASSFLTAGIEGATILGISGGAIPLGIILFLLRNVNMIDGSVKFQNRVNEVKTSFSQAIEDKDYKEMIRLILTTYFALGYSASTTDSIFSAVNKIATWCDAPASIGLKATAYVFCGLGALGGLPMSFYWIHRGMKQISFGGKQEADGTNKDPSDIHTLLAAIGTIPVILGILGAATAATGQAFAMLGLFALVVRMSSSIAYAVLGGVPGLSTLSRGVGAKCRLFASSREEKSPLLPPQPVSGDPTIHPAIA